MGVPLGLELWSGGFSFWKLETHNSQHHLQWNSWSSVLYKKQNEKIALKHHLAYFKNSLLTCLEPLLLTQIVLEKAVQNPSLAVKHMLHLRLSSAVLSFLLMMEKQDLLGWLMVKCFSEAESMLVRQEEGDNCYQPLGPWLGGPKVWTCSGSEVPSFFFITYWLCDLGQVMSSLSLQYLQYLWAFRYPRMRTVITSDLPPRDLVRMKCDNGHERAL